MKASAKLQTQLFIQNGIFALLLIAAAVLIIWVLRDNRVQWDLTQNQRNTLSKATLDVLKKMDGPIRVTAYATLQDPQLGDIRRVIHDFVEPYQRAKPDLTLNFVDPREHPKETQTANVRSNGIESRSGLVHATCSVGAVWLPSAASTSQEAMLRAEHALDKARANGRDGFAVYEPSLQRETARLRDRKSVV